MDLLWPHWLIDSRVPFSSPLKNSPLYVYSWQRKSGSVQSICHLPLWPRGATVISIYRWTLLAPGWLLWSFTQLLLARGVNPNLHAKDQTQVVQLNSNRKFQVIQTVSSEARCSSVPWPKPNTRGTHLHCTSKKWLSPGAHALHIQPPLVYCFNSFPGHTHYTKLW